MGAIWMFHEGRPFESANEHNAMQTRKVPDGPSLSRQPVDRAQALEYAGGVTSAPDQKLRPIIHAVTSASAFALSRP